MKYLRQFLLILLISFIGELLHEVLPLPVPASVYGFAILFIGLLSGAIKLEHVQDTGKLLIEIMPVMFIPAAVGLLETWGLLRQVWLPFCVITLLSTIAVMAVAGHVTQGVLKGSQHKEDAEAQL